MFRRPPCLIHEADESKGGASLSTLFTDCPTEHRVYIFNDAHDQPREVYPWLRLSAYQCVTMRLLCEKILLASPQYIDLISVPLLMQGDVTRFSVNLGSARHQVVLYVSPNNPVSL